MKDGVVEREDKDHSEPAWLSLSSTIQTTIHSEIKSTGYVEGCSWQKLPA
jgi:hypothetical protein